MTILADRLNTSYGSRKVLVDATLDIGTDEVVAVLGANGAGKSTLLRALAGEVQLDEGVIYFDGNPLSQSSTSQQAQMRAVLPQQPGLTFAFTVAEVVAMGAYPFEQASPAEVQAWLVDALTCADALDLKARSYTELSGGEQQRVQFARVLVQCLAIRATKGHAYLLLDEPLASLDPRHQLRLLETLLRLAHTKQVGVLLVLHDVNLAARCDRIALMANLTVIAQGTPDQVLTSSNLQRVFDVEMAVLPHPLVPERLLVLPQT